MKLLVKAFHSIKKRLLSRTTKLLSVIIYNEAMAKKNTSFQVVYRHPKTGDPLVSFRVRHYYVIGATIDLIQSPGGWMTK